MGIRRIISGGQTGADRGGLDAAIALGMDHGGWCPRGRRAEDGTIPACYRLFETTSDDYAERTGLNVTGSDGTVVFFLAQPGPGSALTIRRAREAERPCLVIDLAAIDDHRAADRLAAWIADQGLEVLNVAGARESAAPGLGERVRAIVVAALGAPAERVRQQSLF